MKTYRVSVICEGGDKYRYQGIFKSSADAVSEALVLLGRIPTSVSVIRIYLAYGSCGENSK